MQEILSNNTLRKTILITGATSGIGKALSKIYLENDWTVIGIGRNKTKIKEFSLDFPDNFYKAKITALGNFYLAKITLLGNILLNKYNTLGELFTKQK